MTETLKELIEKLPRYVPCSTEEADGASGYEQRSDGDVVFLRDVLSALAGIARQPPTCDCGRPLTTCSSCAVEDYQAAHTDCPTCCPPSPERENELSDVQKMLVLLSEIRQCINDDHLMAAQRKVMAIEAILKSQGDGE